MPTAYSVLDLATGTGLLTGTFAECRHFVTGLDFADRLLKRARKRFPGIDFRAYDLQLIKSPRMELMKPQFILPLIGAA